MTDKPEINDVVNSVMMAMMKELAKHGINAQHRHYDGNRNIVTGLVATMIAAEENTNAQ